MSFVMDDIWASASDERDPRVLVAKALPKILAYVGAERGSVFLLSGNRVVHKILANKETFTEVSDFKVETVLSEGLAGWVLKHMQGGLVSDTRRDERWVSLGDNSVGSALVVPLISRGCVVGLLSLHHSQHGALRERHLALAAEAAQLLAPSVDVALVTMSTLSSMVQLCRDQDQPSVVIDWQGMVVAVNKAMESLDIIWENADVSQSLLGRALAISTVQDCHWEIPRDLGNLPYRVKSIPFTGAGIWLQCVRKSD